MKIKLPIAEASIMFPDSKLYHIRSTDVLERGTGLGAIVGNTPEGLSVFRSDVHVSARGERQTFVTFLVNPSGQIVAQNIPPTDLNEYERSALQKQAITSALRNRRVWKNASGAWMENERRTSSLDLSLSEAVASTISEKEQALVLNHPAVERLINGHGVSQQVEADGMFLLSGRVGVWIWNDDGGPRRVTLYDGDRQAKGEGKTLTAALDKAAKTRFTKIPRGNR